MSPIRIAFAGLLLLGGLAAQAQTVAIRGATVHTAGPAGTLEDGTVIIADGRIVAVGPDLPIPAGAEVIQATGKIVTPGLFDAHGYLGIVEVSLVGETADHQPMGPSYTAAFEVADAVNPRSMLIPVNRIEGITRAVVTPAPAAMAEPGASPGPISGLGSVIQLGSTDDFLVRRNAALYVQLGETGAALSGGARGMAALRFREALQDAADLAANRRAFDSGQRRDYGLDRLALEALVETMKTGRPVVATVHRASDIQAALRLAREFGLKLVIAGGSEAWIVADELAAAGIPVILDPLENLPARFETLGATLENAARLHAAGVKIAFSVTESHNARNMRQGAGNAVSYGLPPEAALAAMTINPATVFGVADVSGSLEAGKDADVVIWSGDPLEVTTAAERVFIRGRDIPMVSRHTLLRDRYSELAEPLPPQYRR
jgi:imidazolonepropionase-like amidohydrolase